MNKRSHQRVGCIVAPTQDARRERASRELIANFEILGMPVAEVQAALGFTPEQLNETLTVGPSPNRDHFARLRNFLERTIIEQGDEPAPFSLL